MTHPTDPACQQEAPSNIVHMPWQQSVALLMRGHRHGRATVRSVSRTRQAALPLPRETILDKEILAAIDTAAEYRKWAGVARGMGDDRRARKIEGYAAEWDGRLERLRPERAQVAVQGELLPIQTTP